MQEIKASHTITYHPLHHSEEEEGHPAPYTIDFTRPWKRIELIPELERQLGVGFPASDTLGTEPVRAWLDRLAIQHDVACSEPRTSARLLDKFVSKFIEPQCIQPTFLIGHPEIMSPLAKRDRKVAGRTERFELLVAKQEVANAYTELNDPFEQRKRFEQQVRESQQGDQEASAEVDESFLDALEHGLPPTAGWGLGVDRLVMLLTDQDRIAEVIAFPALKPTRAAAAAPTEEEKQP